MQQDPTGMLDCGPGDEGDPKKPKGKSESEPPLLVYALIPNGDGTHTLIFDKARSKSNDATKAPDVVIYVYRNQKLERPINVFVGADATQQAIEAGYIFEFETEIDYSLYLRGITEFWTSDDYRYEAARNDLKELGMIVGGELTGFALAAYLNQGYRAFKYSDEIVDLSKGGDKVTGSAVRGLLGPGLKITDNKLIQHAHQWGIAEKGAALTTDQLNLMRNLVNQIYKNARTIRQGVWGNPAAGGFNNALFYSNGKHIVVTQSDGTMITILRNATGNKHFNNAITLWTR